MLEVSSRDPRFSLLGLLLEPKIDFPVMDFAIKVSIIVLVISKFIILPNQ